MNDTTGDKDLASFAGEFAGGSRRDSGSGGGAATNKATASHGKTIFQPGIFFRQLVQTVHSELAAPDTALRRRGPCLPNFPITHDCQSSASFLDLSFSGNAGIIQVRHFHAGKNWMQQEDR